MKARQHQISVYALVISLSLFGICSCRSDAEKHKDTSTTTTVDPNTTSSLPAKHEAYAAAQDEIGMITSIPERYHSVRVVDDIMLCTKDNPTRTQDKLICDGYTTSLGDVYLAITSPRSGKTVKRGTRVDLIAESNRANELRNVLFYVNGERVRRPSSSRSPYKVRWWARNRGQFVITVKATQRGGQEVSASSSVIVE